VVLNGRRREHLIVDTGASFVLISRQAAADLGITIDENTPFMPVATASSVILNPLVTLRSIQVGKAEVERVECPRPRFADECRRTSRNSFLSKFRVVLDSSRGKMTLFPAQEETSLDRPGGYGREYWSGRFRFYHKMLGDFETD